MTTDQIWNPEQYAQHAQFVSDLGAPLIELLAPKSGEHILDLGCGDGVLTKQLLDLGCDVIGVDASPAMVEAARARGLNVRVMDGQALNFHEEFDAVFSNAALHWMVKPAEVLSGVWQALRPGGRLVVEFGGDGNLTKVLAGLRSVLQDWGIEHSPIQPWCFPTAEQYRAELEAQGFQINLLELFPRPTELPGDITNWLEMFAQPFLAAIPRSRSADFLAQVQDELCADLCDSDGRWTVDYVRLRGHALKPTAG